jgi:hypothetical protein
VEGDDLDGDGDSDVSAAVSTCADADGDGDIEFPPGFYKAGTIVDNDVVFLSDRQRFTVDPAAPDTDADSVDLMAVALHEFGHSHGLAHSMTNQLSPTDGRGAVMFPFIQTADPEAELSLRSLTAEDVAWSSYLYPEGSAQTGPARLGPGDVAFHDVFGLIRGSVRHGVLREPVAGANIYAVHTTETAADAIASSAFSGTVQFWVDPLTGEIKFFRILDGTYVLPVPRGDFRIGVEAIDGDPAPATSFNLTTRTGAFADQLEFPEDFLKRGGRPRTISVEAGETVEGVDIVTSRVRHISNFGLFDTRGFANAPPGTYYLVRVPAAQIIEAAGPTGSLVVESADFYTAALDVSTVPIFAEALLTIGTVNPDGTASVDLGTPLARVTDFVGQDHDFARFAFDDPRGLGRRVRDGITKGQIQNLFLVLRVPTTPSFPGVHGFPPLIGLDVDEPIFGLSYVSTDGATFTRSRRNFMFSLTLSGAR